MSRIYQICVDGLEAQMFDARGSASAIKRAHEWALKWAGHVVELNERLSPMKYSCVTRVIWRAPTALRDVAGDGQELPRYHGDGGLPL